MFTGLVRAIGEVVAIEPGAAGARLVLRAPDWEYHAQEGDSICISGCCLTVAQPPRDDLLVFDAVAETLARTTLGLLQAGSRVNLEPSLSAADLMGGHMVQGHVEGVGAVTGVQQGDDYRIAVRAPAELMPAIVPKGSITVDGVSLTVAHVDVNRETFEVALIPTTLRATTLGELREGGRCNLETDIIARTVVHWLEQYGKGR
jgi:riboflavin synthase